MSYFVKPLVRFSWPPRLAVGCPRKGDFVRNLTEHLLSYALGRDLEPPDQAAVRKICDAAAAKNQGALAWMLEIVQSYPFRYRRWMGGR